MLSEITLEIPDADPYFRTAEEIEKAKNFHTNHGAEFCWKIAKAVNVVAHLRPHDPIAPFVDAFRSKSAHETGSKMAENPFSFTPLEAEVSAISVQNGCDATGSAALDIVLEMNGEAESFRIGFYFHQVTDGVTKVNLPPDDVQLRQRISAATAAVVQDWFLTFQRNNGCVSLKNLMLLDQSLTEFYDAKTVIPDVPLPPFDFTGKKGKEKHPALKMPWPPKPNPIQRIKHNPLEDGYGGLCYVSFAAFCLTARRLQLPIRRFIRVVAKILVPGVEFPVGVPVPFLSVFAHTKKSSGKVRILQDIMVAPRETYEPATFFEKSCSVVSSFKAKMHEHQNWKMHNRTSMTWGMEKIQDGFSPLVKLLKDADFRPGLVVSLNTHERLAKGNYDVKGKPRPPEHIVKILSTLFRRYPDMVAVLNPIHFEHRDRLKPFCDQWTGQARQPLLFHESFSAFHETLSAYPVNFRGALVSIKAGEDTVSSMVRRIAAAEMLGLAVCLQNATGMASSDSTVLLEIAVRLGVEYVKFDGVGHHNEIWAAAECYHTMAEAVTGRKSVLLSAGDSGQWSGRFLPDVRSKQPVDCVRPAGE